MSFKKDLNEIRARLMPMYPLSIVFGGLEHQCLETCKALQQIGVATELLDFYKPDDKFDVLHLFGSNPNYYDICYHAKQPIIISSVSGSRQVSHLRTFILKRISSFTKSVQSLYTNYYRLQSVYKAASIVICLNQQEALLLEATYSVPKNRIRIITNGVTDEYFNASGELFIQKYGIDNFVLFTGNIVQRKNPLRLAKVLQRLGYPGVFIGGTLTREQEYADAFAAIIANSPNLKWIPRLHHDDPLLASAYAAARVFCLPSTEETQSLSALEAMSTGTPVIQGNLLYAYQSPFEKTLRCNPRDEASLAECLKLAMEKPEQYSVKLSDKYRWQNIALEISDIYKQAMTQST